MPEEFLFCHMTIHWCILHDFGASHVGHLENNSSWNYADLLNVDTSVLLYNLKKKITFINITAHLIRKAFNYESAVKFTAVDSDGHACWSPPIDSNAVSQKCLGDTAGPTHLAQASFPQTSPLPKPELPPDRSLWYYDRNVTFMNNHWVTLEKEFISHRTCQGAHSKVRESTPGRGLLLLCWGGS